jgi:hypothetical protein
MDAAIFASVALDGRVRIDNGEFVFVGGHSEFVARYDRDLGKQGAGRLPAFGAAADVVVGALAVDRDGDFLVGTVTEQGAAREVCRCGFDSLIDRRMNGYCIGHWIFSFFPVYVVATASIL